MTVLLTFLFQHSVALVQSRYGAVQLLEGGYVGVRQLAFQALLEGVLKVVQVRVAFDAVHAPAGEVGHGWNGTSLRYDDNNNNNNNNTIEVHNSCWWWSRRRDGRSTQRGGTHLPKQTMTADSANLNIAVYVRELNCVRVADTHWQHGTRRGRERKAPNSRTAEERLTTAVTLRLLCRTTAVRWDCGARGGHYKQTAAKARKDETRTHGYREEPPRTESRCERARAFRSWRGRGNDVTILLLSWRTATAVVSTVIIIIAQRLAVVSKVNRKRIRVLTAAVGGRRGAVAGWWATAACRRSTATLLSAALFFITISARRIRLSVRVSSSAATVLTVPRPLTTVIGYCFLNGRYCTYNQSI